MSEEDAGADGPAGEQQAQLRLANGALAGPVLCRVVSMVLTRADWPVDRLHDAMLVCDALLAHAPAYTNDGQVTFSLARRDGLVELRVEDLSADGASALMRDATLPGVGNVLERIPESVRVESGERGSRLVLVLSRG